MFPKGDVGQARLAASLDHWAEFRHESIVAALTLGCRLERAVTYGTIEALLSLVKACSGSGAGAFAGTSKSTGSKLSSNVPPESGSRKSRRGARHEQRCGDPRNLCSGRNRHGLNYYVPRKREARSGHASTGSACNTNTHRSPPRASVLRCGALDESLESFLEEHRPSKREAERLQVCVDGEGGQGGPEDASPLSNGLLEDAQRLEACGALSQKSIVELAQRWHCMRGKWLIFVPEWRIDDLFANAVRRLREGSLEGCTALIVSPPGTFGIDPDRFMLSAHCGDFTDRHQTMAVGKSLRAAAREGLHCPAGSWGELRDDPFAAREKKVALLFKPDVFSHLGIHRNNPYGIKTALFVLDL